MEHEPSLPLSYRFQIRSIFRDAYLWTLSAVLYLASDCRKPEQGGEGEDKTQVLSFHILVLGKKKKKWISQDELHRENDCVSLCSLTCGALYSTLPPKHFFLVGKGLIKKIFHECHQSSGERERKKKLKNNWGICFHCSVRLFLDAFCRNMS